MGNGRHNGTHNVNADEGNKDTLSSQVLDRDSDTDDGDDELANTHSCGTDEEETTTTEALDTPDTGESHEDIDDTSSNGDDERVGDTGGIEERGAVVEDEVDWICGSACGAVY